MIRPIASCSLLLLCAALAGCPGPEEPTVDGGPGTDAPGLDAPMPGVDAPGTDAPGLDAPGTDAPVIETDAPGADAPPSACLSGYPSLDSSNFITGLRSPVDAMVAPGTTDWFIAERGGRIRVADSSGAVVGVFLDMTALIGSEPSGGNEQGLLGLAFHPDYATNGLFYVSYTPNTGGSGNNIVAVGTRSAGNPRMAMGTVTPILTIPDFTWNHNGGCLRFGPDGELYIGTGDGGGGGDPQDNGQDETQLLGKILRIHVDATTGTSYTIPAGNPFTGAGEREEIWATGVRNPWRFSFDRDTGDFWMGDVGQNTWEEINVALAGTGAGANYGWSDCEGLNNFGAGGACSLAGHHAPIVTARHGSDPVVGSAVSITGGYVYRGSAIPALEGAYLFADLAGWVAALRYCDGTVREYEEIDSLSGDCSGATVGFAEDTAGELYMVCIGDGAANGTIRRITAP